MLEPSNVGRNWLTNVFSEQLAVSLVGAKDFHVGVVGGSIFEPELIELSKFVTDFKTSTLGIEKTDHYLDLNTGPATRIDLRFDLILCSQVLEHVWNHQKAFESLYDLVTPGGNLWINVPTSNREHGSPDYFSAGFTSSYLEQNLQLAGFEVVKSGSVGTKRNYLATHSLPYWLSVNSHRFPLLYMRYKTSKLKNLYFFFRYFLTLFKLQFTSSALQNSGPYLTESWAIAKKPH